MPRPRSRTRRRRSPRATASTSSTTGPRRARRRTGCTWSASACPAAGRFCRTSGRSSTRSAGGTRRRPEGRQSIRLTTRQNIQFHWIKKADLAAVVRDIAKSGFFALNGCGDNVRNVMGCPLSKFSTLVNVHELAHRYGTYFQLPEQAHIQIFGVDTAYDRVAHEQRVGSKGRFEYGPMLLNRKFKVAFSVRPSHRGRHRDGQLCRASHQRPRRRAGHRERQARRLPDVRRRRSGREERQVELLHARRAAGRLHARRTARRYGRGGEGPPGMGRPQEPPLGPAEVRRPQPGHRVVPRASAGGRGILRRTHRGLRRRASPPAPWLADAREQRHARLRPVGRERPAHRPR